MAEQRLSEGLAHEVVQTIRQPLLVLNGELRVQSANRAFLEYFQVSQEETDGRPIYELGNGQWDIPRLRELLGEILPERREVYDFQVERDFPDLGHRTMLLSARQLIGANGAKLMVVAIEDISDRRRWEYELEAQKELAEKTIDAVRDPLLILHWDLQVQSANDSFYEHFRASREETEGRMIYELGNGQWNIPRLRELLENVLPQNNAFDDYEVEHDFPDLGRRVMILNARRIDHLKLILLAIEDATQRRMAERRRQFVIDLNDTIRDLQGAQEIAVTVNARVAEHLRVSRAVYGEVDAEQRRVTILYGFHDEGTAERRNYAIDEIGPEVIATLQAGKPLIVDDIQDDPRTSAWAEACAGFDVRALLCVPVFRDGQLEAFFAVAQRNPRAWPEVDVALVEQMAERTHAAVEQARAEHAVRQSEARYRNLAETLEQRVAERTEQLRGLAARLTRAEEQERRRLADVLHDHVQQLLIACTMRVAVVREDVRNPATREHLQTLDELLHEAIHATRTLSVEIAPPILHERGLPEAIEWLARRLEGQHRFPLEVEADASANPAREENRDLLFQAGRELVLNVIKHAETDRAWIRLTREGEAVRFEVIDRGKGFDPSQVESATESFGLFHLRERLEAVNGRLSIESQPGRGTRVVMCVAD